MRGPSPEVERFAAVVQRDEDELELDVAALLIGAWEHEAFDVEPHRRALDALAARSAAAVGAAATTDEAARALARTLFVELGFRGNTEDYYDPRNSFLADVLERKVGIPITLSVLYVEVARRLGLAAAGVGFPGHFLVRVDGTREPLSERLILDPFGGGAVLDRAGLAALLARASGPDARLEDVSLAPTPKRAILVRMLNNLAGIYGRTGDTFRSLEVYERIAVLDPSDDRLAASVERLRRLVSSLN
jgi:regulator of sirC expression with transglutaminase-like and TPR domain